jgi:hypothetical protein
MELKHGNRLKIADCVYAPDILVHLPFMSEFKCGGVFPLKISPCVAVPLQEFETCRNHRLLSKRLKTNHAVNSKLELELKFGGVIDNGSNETARLPNCSNCSLMLRLMGVLTRQQ